MIVRMGEPDHIPALQAILTRHASFLDMETRETLWVPIITVPSAVQNS